MEIAFNADVPAQNYVRPIRNPILGLSSERPRETSIFIACNNALNKLSG